MYSSVPFVCPNCTTDVLTIPSGTSEEEARCLYTAHTADMRNTRTLLALENYHNTLYIQSIPEEYIVKIHNGNLGLIHVISHKVYTFLVAHCGHISMDNLRVNRDQRSNACSIWLQFFNWRTVSSNWSMPEVCIEWKGSLHTCSATQFWPPAYQYTCQFPLDIH